MHQFTPSMVPVRALKKRDGLATVINVDGFGGQEIKIAKYREFVRTAKAAGLGRGFKLFYREDTKLMRPARSSGCRRRLTSSSTSSAASRA